MAILSFRCLNVFLLGAVTIGIAGCATKGNSKIVVREGDRQAIAYLPDAEIIKGDYLLLLSEHCPTKKQGSGPCKQVPAGRATVLERLDKRFARIRFDRGAEIYEGEAVKSDIR